ncbi:MAG: hypothetical protein ACRC4M_01460 [Mycoplasma sp.]
MPFNAKPISTEVPTTIPSTQNTMHAPASHNAGHASTIENQPTANIEEKVAQLSLQFNQILVKPYLQQALDYLKSSKTDAINSYNQLSDQIAAEIKVITQNANIITLRLEEANEVINRTQEVIRNKYNNASEEEISTGELNLEYEYNTVAEHYELSLQLSQEVSNYKARISSLLNLQELLDNSTVPFVNRIQIEVDNLELLVHNFDSSTYADIVAKKQGVSGQGFGSHKPMQGRSQELNKLAGEFTTQTKVSNAPKVEEMKRREDVVEQHVQTAPKVETTTTSTFSQSDMSAQDMSGLSRDEQRMMKKMREQQMKFEHMMRMNEMIFEYNKKVDEMMARQREYENRHSVNQEVESEQQPKQVYESNMPVKSLKENAAKSQSDKLFIVREAQPVTEAYAKQMTKKDSTKSIRVVK